MLKSKSPRLVERPKPGRSTAMPPVRARNGSHIALLVGTPCRYSTDAPGAVRQTMGCPSSSASCTCIGGGRRYFAPMPVLCLGEALVDLVCERPISGLAEADAFVPPAGGALANVAVIAARHGASVALAG